MKRTINESINSEKTPIFNIKDLKRAFLKEIEELNEFYLVDFQDKEYVENLSIYLRNSNIISKKKIEKNQDMILILVTPYQHLIERARKLGIYVIAFWDKQQLLLNSLEKETLANEYYVFDISNINKLEKMMDFVIKERNPNYIYHLGRESNMLDTFKIAEKKMKSLNSASSINFLNNKYLMRKLLEDNQISSINYIYIERIEDLYNQLSKFEFPFIIKPTQLSGSTGVYLCENLESIRTWIELINSYEYNGPFLLEEYLIGQEVSVEVISFDGEHSIYGITDKIKSKPPFFVEYGHIHPSQLPLDEQQKIKNLVKNFLNLANYKFGPSHTEVILTKNGPKIVESQARFGGDGIPKLVQLVTGNDMYEDLFKSLLANELPIVSQPKGAAAVHSFQWPSGKLKSITGIDEISDLSYVDQLVTPKIGSNIEEIKNSSNRPGFFIVSGESEEAVKNRIEKVNELLSIEIN